ncbi:PREDICTED: progestin and adipoQ receptor family member 6 [Thamnophis sirtalis]|uniref:Progestin and adipoQ receptor family member 6 n=1 Tax=Thamnophis sirtalis TaxID=35019 RepID=A0A6I9YLR3_9SAUR|nr:PREDICTED: progestin and adipoQ receptor family member 6 [Thamnophis sirtalis]
MLTIRLPQIFRIHQVPRIFWEEGIISGYRHPKSSALDCVLSSFQLNNETVNIWTHFLPTWYFLWRFVMLSYRLDLWADTYSWPFLAYMSLVCLYPFTSSCAHTFSTMSTHARHICYFLDYNALSLYSLGCAFTYGAYAMPDRWVNSLGHHYFVPMAAINSLICTSLSCYSRFLELEWPRWSKAARMAAFVYPFFFDNIPLFFRYCHSHQLFHICAVVGTHFQLEAILGDLNSRRTWLSAHTPPGMFTHTFAILGATMLGNLALFSAFAMALFRLPASIRILQGGLPESEGAKEK